MTEGCISNGATHIGHLKVIARRSFASPHGYILIARPFSSGYPIIFFIHQVKIPTAWLRRCVPPSSASPATHIRCPKLVARPFPSPYRHILSTRPFASAVCSQRDEPFSFSNNTFHSPSKDPDGPVPSLRSSLVFSAAHRAAARAWCDATSSSRRYRNISLPLKCNRWLPDVTLEPVFI
jgi:hypothetical protein